MHKGEFEGANAKDQQVKILILGESHHISTEVNSPNRIPGVEATYETKQVIRERYLKSYNASTDNRDPAYRFFDKIVQTFGIDPEIGRTEFWDRVYFGNYVDVLCGVGNGLAKNQIKTERNRPKYNDDLFEFVNNHEITKIFCFSVLAYKNFPSMVQGEENSRKEVGLHGKNKVYLYHCLYKAGIEHGYTSKVLKRDLEVFGIRHPSAKGGYPLDLFAKELIEKI